MRLTGLIVRLAVAASVVATLGSCRRQGFSGDPSIIWDTGSYTVYCDSITTGDSPVALSSPLFERHTTDSLFAAGLRPSYHSPQRLVDNIYLASVSRCYHLVTSDSLTPMETAGAAIAGMAMVAPRHLMDALRRQTKGGRIRRSDDWPLSTGHEIWAEGAWETYLATGNRRWLDESRDIIRRTLSEDCRVSVDDSLALVRGASTLSDNGYPGWMTRADIWQATTLSASVATARAARILAMMDAEASDRKEVSEADSLPDIACGVNDRLWIPNLGRYGQYLYGAPYPIVSHTADNRGQALAVVTGIATTDMASSLIGRTPCQPEGVAELMPTEAGREPRYGVATQTLWTLAALRARNGAALRASLGAQIYLAAARPDTSSLDAMASGIATVMRVVAGITLTPDAMRFRPLIPAQLSGTKRITGLTYRNSTIDITVEGTGDAISVFKLDGRPASDHCVPADIAPGHHTVEITMNGASTDEGEINFAQPVTMPETPEIAWTSQRTATITNSNAETEYMLYLDGVFDTQTTESRLTLFEARSFTTIAVEPVREEETWGYGARPYWFMPAGTVKELPATALGAPVPKPERVRIKRRWVTRTPAPPRFVESAPGSHPDISTAVTVDRPGEYFLDVSYSNADKAAAMRTVTINGRPFGPLVMPSTGAVGRAARSNVVRINLIAGLNHIDLKFTPPAARGAISVESLRLIRR